MKRAKTRKNLISILLATLGVVFAFITGFTYCISSLTLEYGTHPNSTSAYMANQQYHVINDTVDLEKIKSMSTEDARYELMKLKGVGRKVADCILLFGYHRTDVFPTDTWVVQAYNQIYGTNSRDAIAISKHFVKEFGELSGYAQQYLYYQMRESNLGEKI